MKNVTTQTDLYKIGHWKAINPGLEWGKSYMEPRIGAKYPELCWIGTDMIINDEFCDKVTEEMIKRGERRSHLAYGVDGMYNSEVWRKVQKLGYLPIRIKAVKEGTVVPNGNVFMTFEPTVDWFAKTYNSLESTLMHIRYPTDIATRAMNIKRGILPSFLKSSDVTEYVLPFAVNDFGYRGATGSQAAQRGGAAFMVHFAGSDNIPAMDYIEDIYGLEDRLKSVWATEHSVQLSFPNDLDYVLYQLIQANPSQIVSIVIDGRDQDAFVREVISHPEVRKLVKIRAAVGGRTVWRPDRGKPITNVCKYSDMIGAYSGFTLNTKGYKVLNDNQGLIQGDGMNEHTIPELYSDYIKTGWAADNIITGSGGGLLQEDTSRDLNRWAIKPCQYKIDSKILNISKKGVGDETDKSKASKEGDVKLHKMGNAYITIESSKETPQQFNSYVDQLEVVYENGVHNKSNFTDIIERAKVY